MRIQTAFNVNIVLKSKFKSLDAYIYKLQSRVCPFLHRLLSLSKLYKEQFYWISMFKSKTLFSFIQQKKPTQKFVQFIKMFKQPAVLMVFEHEKKRTLICIHILKT